MRQEILAVLDRYADAWSSRDLQRVADLWDEGDDGLTYVAEELGEVLLDRERIVEHLLRTEHRLAIARVSLRDVHVRELAPGLALASFVCRWDLEWVSHSRVSVVLRRRGARWSFVHYMEAPFHMEDRGDES
ncbi:nuclear transport factor 2 family protein [Streptomyces fuscichromogenes]|uniref:nuclear transport factor 2 family protein n=1 Tax=Streptomyces fuscichromogenes TaxID=1324013 RepID=UPI00380FEA76